MQVTSEKGARPHMEDQNCVVDYANEILGTIIITDKV